MNNVAPAMSTGSSQVNAIYVTSGHHHYSSIHLLYSNDHNYFLESFYERQLYKHLKKLYLILIWPLQSTYLLTYSMALQTFKGLDHHLERVSLSSFIYLHLFLTRGRVMGDISIAPRA